MTPHLSLAETSLWRTSQGWFLSRAEPLARPMPNSFFLERSPPPPPREASRATPSSYTPHGGVIPISSVHQAGGYLWDGYCRGLVRSRLSSLISTPIPAPRLIPATRSAIRRWRCRWTTLGTQTPRPTGPETSALSSAATWSSHGDEQSQQMRPLHPSRPQARTGGLLRDR